MSSSSEQHQYYIRNNSSEKLNPFTNNMEVHLYTDESKYVNPFNVSVEQRLIPESTSTSFNSPVNQAIARFFIKNNIDSSIKILVNSNNSIINTTNDYSITTVEDEASKFKIERKGTSQGN